MQINAFQRVADVVLQKSLREGFGLTVSEGLWKGRPVVGGRAGGIKLQIREGYDGYLVDSVEECAQRTIDLLADPVGARTRSGPKAASTSARTSSPPTSFADWLTLSGTSGSDARHAPRAVPVLGGRGWIVRVGQRHQRHRPTALLPLVDRDVDGERPSWVAAAIGDGDLATVQAGATTVPSLDLHLLALDPDQHRMHYDVISNAVLWFLHHGLFNLAYRPRFDRHLRRRGTATSR